MKVIPHAATRSLALAVLTAASVMLAASSAAAAGPASTPLSQSSAVTASGTVGYDLSSSTQSIGMSGCMMCHGDTSLVRDTVVDGKVVSKSYYINPALVLNSAHRNVLCTGCHLDFDNESKHKNRGTDWRLEVKRICKDCHPKQYDEYAQSSHAVQDRPGAKVVKLKPGQRLPDCGDCHGGHGIETLKDNEPARARLRTKGKQVCGQCHPDAWSSYSDYYHGAAYKRGAPDAPACWSCHGAHLVLKKSDKRSTVGPELIKTTCGKCHDGVDQGYVNYSVAIHGRRAAIEGNPVFGFVKRATSGLAETVTGIIGTMQSWFGS